MRERKVDAWEFIRQNPVDALCITTNGAVRKDGACVMGAGIAKQAAQRYPSLPYFLGDRISQYGNQTYLYRPGVDFTVGADASYIVSLPVKHHWREIADIELITVSVKKLVFLTNALGWERVVVPRPGVGNGRLNWDYVKGRIEPLLDDRFTLVYQ